jgi:putative toxin-antitoxin system antitoxin component (TIGR02293 family)
METIHSVESVLGGKATLKASPRSARDWHALLEAGLPRGVLDALKQATSLSDAQLASLVGVSGKTLQRGRATRGRLDSVTSDRLFRAARLVALAGEVLEDRERGIAWLGRAQIGLGGVAPFALMTTDAGCEQVEQLLLRIEHGVYA